MWIPGKNLAFIFEITSFTVGTCKNGLTNFYKKVFQEDFGPAPVVTYFNSEIKTVINDRYFIEDSFEELINKIDQWTRMDNR